MRIGIDFDNTIVNYDPLFSSLAEERSIPVKGAGDTHLSRQTVRDYIRTHHPDQDAEWQVLQGIAYGPRIFDAPPMNGIHHFIQNALALGHEIHVISHKTEFASIDPTQTPLRKAALNWLNTYGLTHHDGSGIPIENIYFAATRYDKVCKISDLKCDIFIDDLVEVFQENHFPDQTEGYLFNPHAPSGTEGRKPWRETLTSWEHASDRLLGQTLCLAGIEQKCGQSIFSVSKVTGGGNNRLYCITLKDGKRLALKDYKSGKDANARMEREWSALTLFGKFKFSHTPSPFFVDRDRCQTVFEWVVGAPPAKIDDDHIKSAVKFVESLKQLRNTQNAEEIMLARESCLSLDQLINQISNRLSRLKSSLVTSQKLPLILSVATDKANFFINQAKSSFDNFGISHDEILSREIQTLSPSDFGFHNSLETTGQDIKWVDFEYFGWDDPVKLISDFAWHPAMALTQSQTKNYINGTLALFAEEDKTLCDRFQAMYPLYGVRWLMIVLNIFDHKQRTRIAFAHGEDKMEELEQQRLTSAQKILTELSKIAESTEVL